LFFLLERGKIFFFQMKKKKGIWGAPSKITREMFFFRGGGGAGTFGISYSVILEKVALNKFNYVHYVL